MTLTLDELRARRSTILEIAARHGVLNGRVFGTVLRGECGPDSDIDLLIQLEEDRSLFDLIDFKHELEDLLGRPVDVVTERAISPYIRDEVLRVATAL